VILLVPGMLGAIFVITDILFGLTTAVVGTAYYHRLFRLRMVRNTDMVSAE
jgi:hypothetical protein